MSHQGARIWEKTISVLDEASPERAGTLQRRRRHLVWRRQIGALWRRVALPAALLLAVAASVTIPLPARAAHLGTGWGERIYASASTTGNTVAWQQYATARIAFSGKLIPSIGRTMVTIVIQNVDGSATGAGTLIAQAKGVFTAHPISLPALFAAAGVSAHPGVSYRIAVDAGSTTLTSATVTIAR